MHNLSCENKFYLHENEKWFAYQRLSTYPRFETLARGNSGIASIRQGAFIRGGASNTRLKVQTDHLRYWTGGTNLNPVPISTSNWPKTNTDHNNWLVVQLDTTPTRTSDKSISWVTIIKRPAHSNSGSDSAPFPKSTISVSAVWDSTRRPSVVFCGQ